MSELGIVAACELVADWSPDSVLNALTALERVHGVGMTIRTKEDVGDLWDSYYAVEEAGCPNFCDEVWERVRNTWEWRKGWGESVHPDDLVHGALDEVAGLYRCFEGGERNAG